MTNKSFKCRIKRKPDLNSHQSLNSMLWRSYKSNQSKCLTCSDVIVTTILIKISNINDKSAKNKKKWIKLSCCLFNTPVFTFPQKVSSFKFLSLLWKRQASPTEWDLEQLWVAWRQSWWMPRIPFGHENQILRQGWA